MIDTATFFGGAKYTTMSGDVQLYRSDARVQTFKTSSPHAVLLPNIAEYQGPKDSGLRFIVLVDPASAENITILGSAYEPGEVALVYYTGSGHRVVKRTVNAVRTVGHGARGTIPVDPATTQILLECFQGTDCEYAASKGSHPLDGENGRDLCVIPMFQNPGQLARNLRREPVRAADVVMPSVIIVRFNQDCLSADPLHPLASTSLPQNFYNKLINIQQSATPGWHALQYDPDLHLSGVSRHWHHIQRQGAPPSGTAWLHSTDNSNVSVFRHVWKKIIPYVDDGVDYEIEIRMVAEHNLSGEPGIDLETDPGGTTRANGAWGSLFMLYVFCNQLSPTFVDGNTFTPVGSSIPITFSKDDPCVWGEAKGVTPGQGVSKKFCHPQLIIAGNIPVTFQAPAGYYYMDWLERKWLKNYEARTEGDYDLRGKNREYCYKMKNSSPWLPGTCTDPAPYTVFGGNNANSDGGINNVVYSVDGTLAQRARGMTLGGDFPNSHPMEWICLENGLAVGRTYLVPSKPGWKEDCGTLDVMGGSCVAIRICMEPDYNLGAIDDGNGSPVWPGWLFSECIGHPTEPFGGVGGGHNCYNNGGGHNNGTTRCCIRMDEYATASSEHWCATTTTVYNGISGVDCRLQDQYCSSASLGVMSLLLEVDDYVLSYNDGDGRTASWVRYLRKQDQVLFDYVYDSGDVASFTQTYGSWSFAATVTGSGTNSGLLKSLLLYGPSSSISYRDANVKVKFKRCLTTEHGVGVRMAGVSSTATQGYVGVITPTGSTNGTVELRYYRTTPSIGFDVLATKNITDLTAVVEVEFDLWGTDVTMKWTVNGGDEDMIFAQHCSNILLGKIGFFSLTSSATVEFADIDITDYSYDYEFATAFMNNNNTGMSFPGEMHDTFFTQCDFSGPEDCGDYPENCNCVHNSENRRYHETVLWNFIDFYSDIPETKCNAGPFGSDVGTNPTIIGARIPTCTCSGVLCDGVTHPCGQCPPPFVALTLKFPSACIPDGENVDDIPNLCNGFAYWIIDTIACI